MAFSSYRQETDKPETIFQTGQHDSEPEVDLALCNGCGGCIEVAPDIFKFNEVFGFLEVVDLDYYDPECVEEAIKNCPKKAIRLVRSKESNIRTEF